MLTRSRRAAAVLASGAMAFGLAACGDDEPDAAPATGGNASEQESSAGGSVEQPQPVTGGTTTLRVDRTALGVLDAVGVEVEPLDEATLEDGRFEFPITGGSVDIDTPSGAIEHDGGLRFSAAGRTLDARELVIRPGEDVLTAVVAGERVPLLAVDLNAITVPTSDAIVLPGRAATLSLDVLSSLEQELGVDLPKAALRLGRVDVSAET